MKRKIVFILSANSNPNHIKRMEEFANMGYEVDAYSFIREKNIMNKPNGVVIQNIGEFSSDLPYHKRLGVMIKGIKNVLELTKDEQCIFYLMRNDIAMLFTLISKKPYIFEEADMTHLNTGAAFLRYIFEARVKHIIRNSVISVFRSEGFLKYHFGEDMPQNTYVIPNRLHPSIVTFPFYEKKTFNEHHIRFGFVGGIRYISIFNFAKILLERYPQHEMHFYGKYPSAASESRFAELQSFKNCFFHGEFRSPNDLPHIYSEIDILLSAYDIRSINPRYAEPNKLYEAIYFNTPIIVSSGSFLGEKVQRLGIGYEVDAMSLNDIVFLINSLSETSVAEKINAIKQIDKKSCINTNPDFFNKLDKLIEDVKFD